MASPARSQEDPYDLSGVGDQSLSMALKPPVREEATRDIYVWVHQVGAENDASSGARPAVPLFIENNPSPTSFDVRYIMRSQENDHV